MTEDSAHIAAMEPRWIMKDTDLHRRTFLKGIIAGLAALPLVPRVDAALAAWLDGLASDLAANTASENYWKRLRQEFLTPSHLLHFNTGSLGATPRAVIDAVAEYMRELERDPVGQAWGPLRELTEAVRHEAAALIGADPEELAIVRNTTEAMNAIASGVDLAPGDEILTTDHEHAGGMICWQYLAERTQARIVQLEMPVPATSADELVARVAEHLNERTRICSFSHVDTLTGVRLPLARIAELTRRRGILLACDGAQAPGMLQVDVHALQVDTYASSSHKWMLAPKGSGLLYVRRAVQDRVRPPLLRSGFSCYSGSSGTRNVPHIIGHGLAVDMHRLLTPQKIENRCLALRDGLAQRLQELPGARILSPTAVELRSALLAVTFEGRDAGDIYRALRERDIVVKALPATMVVTDALQSRSYNALRFSTHIYNSEAELDQLTEALAQLTR